MAELQPEAYQMLPSYTEVPENTSNQHVDLAGSSASHRWPVYSHESTQIKCGANGLHEYNCGQKVLEGLG